MGTTTKAFEILSDLSARGITLGLEDNHLRYDGPPAASTVEAMSSLERHREQLVALIRERDRPSFALSHGQRALWFLHQVAPESPAYHIKFAGRVFSEVDTPALRRAFHALVSRHPMLRTTFTAPNGVPVQQVHERQDLWFEEIDASRWTWDELNERTREAFRRPFDLEHGPLLRVHLFSRSKTEHVLLLTVHHLVADRWSMWVLARELQALYAAETLGLPSPALPPLALSYANFVSWQDQLLSGPAGEQLWSYWKEQLAGDLTPLNLPTDRVRPAVQTFKGASHEIDLTAALTSRLKTLAQAQGVTLYMVLLAAFQVLLHRHTGQEDILVGSPTAGRSHALLANVVGYFVNPVVVRATLSRNPTFRTLLAQVRERSVDALRHQDFPFPLLVERLQPTRDPSRSPVFQAAFSLGFLSQHAEVPELDLPGRSATRVNFGGLEIGSFDLDHQEGQFDLDLDIMPGQGSLTARFRYNTDVFAADTIARMAGHYGVILRSIVDDPGQRIGEIALLTPSERERALVQWNATASDYPKELCVHQLFEAQAARTPDAIAVTRASSGPRSGAEGQLTYRDLNRRANRLARVLRERGVEPDVRVGVCMERSLEAVIGLLAILKAGGAYVPLETEEPAERLAHIVRDAGITVMLAQSSSLDRVQAMNIRTLCVDTEECRLGEPLEHAPVNHTTPEHLAYVMYTSGSTGTPKGVAVTHRNVVRLVFGLNRIPIPCGPSETLLHMAPLSFDAATFELWGALLHGARLVAIPKETALSPKEFADTLRRSRISVMFITSSLLNHLVGEMPSVFHGLRCVLVGGEAVDPHFVRLVLEKGPPEQLVNGYGPTETTTFATAYPVKAVEHDATTIPIGYPIGDTTAYVVDQHMNLVPVGVPGELMIGGDGVARGYVNQPELTAARFVADPFSRTPGARLYRTGDTVRYRPDGALEFLGRLDHQVKIRGYRIEPAEIEGALLRHPGVRSAVVVCRNDRSYGKRLIAYFVATESTGRPTASDFRAYLKERLPDYMVPALFVELQKFPMTANGKLDRLRLPSPAEIVRANDAEFVPPGTPTQQILAAMWAELLGVDKVGLHDGFFELGGHSLLTMQLIFRMQDTFGVELPVRHVLQSPTLEKMAHAIDALRRGERLEDSPTGSVPILQRDATLEPDIRPPAEMIPVNSEPRAILLTGATSFLGSFLLQELLAGTSASIYCLGRARDPEEAAQQMQRKLRSYGICDEVDMSRVKPISGDLCQPRLGLSGQVFDSLAEELDAIYHVGAQVKFTHPYSALKGVNVEGTRSILKLASARKAIPVHYISTLLVFTTPSFFDGRVIRETDDPDGSQSRFLGYADSKWVGEQLVRAAGERGLPTTIYRLGPIVGHSRTGAWRPDDHLARAIKGGIQLRKWPDIGMWIQPAPVDFVSKAIYYLSRKPDSAGRVFHVINPNIFTSNELFTWIQSLGYSVDLVPFPVWQAELLHQIKRSADNALAPLAPLLMEPVSPKMRLTFPEALVPPMRPRIDAGDTQAALAGSSVSSCPKTDFEWFKRCIGFFIQSGFLDPPRSGAARIDPPRMD